MTRSEYLRQEAERTHREVADEIERYFPPWTLETPSGFWSANGFALGFKAAHRRRKEEEK